MYYQVLINGKSLGVFGHKDIMNLHLSITATKENSDVSASAVCKEDGKKMFYNWFQEDLGPNDKVEFVPVSEADAERQVPEPINCYEFGRRSNRESSTEITCDFCNRNETEAGKIIRTNLDTPTICSRCVQVCNLILGTIRKKSNAKQ